MTKRKSLPTISPVEFIDRVIKREEKGEPFSLSPFQRWVLGAGAWSLCDPYELYFELVVAQDLF